VGPIDCSAKSGTDPCPRPLELDLASLLVFGALELRRVTAMDLSHLTVSLQVQLSVNDGVVRNVKTGNPFTYSRNILRHVLAYIPFLLKYFFSLFFLLSKGQLGERVPLNRAYLVSVTNDLVHSCSCYSIAWLL